MSALKVLVVGPKGSGKTTIANYLAEFSETLVVSNNYKPTKGTRILECERNRVVVELWDCSGDQVYEGCWPAIMKEAQGVLLVYKAGSRSDEQDISLWYEWFVQNAGLDPVQTLVLAHAHDKDEGRQLLSGGKSTKLPKAIRVVNTSADDPESIRQEFDDFIVSLRDFARKAPK